MKQKDIIFILASAFFVVLVWIIFEIYHNSINSTISEKLNIQIVPIKADFDTKTVENIKNSNKVSPLYETNIDASPSPTASQTPQPTTSVEESLNEASTGGELL